MRAERQTATYTDLRSWPEDGRRYELYDGEVYVCPAPMPRHQLALLELAARLRGHAALGDGLVLVSPIDIVFSETTVLQPDIALFVASRRHHVALDCAIRVPPDIVVEVLSPSTAWNDLGRKKAAFARFGVLEYWLVDPHGKRMSRHLLRGTRYELDLSAGPHEVFSSDVLGGFECAIDAIFSQ